MFKNSLSKSESCFPIMKDILNDLIVVVEKKSILTMLCEYVSASRLVRISLDQIFVDSNEAKPGHYRISAFELDTLRTSLILLKGIEKELVEINISLSKH